MRHDLVVQKINLIQYCSLFLVLQEFICIAYRFLFFEKLITQIHLNLTIAI